MRTILPTLLLLILASTAACAGDKEEGSRQKTDSASNARSGSGPGPTLYVAPNGNDGNPGTEDKPLASLGAATAKASGATVKLAPGSYPEQSISGPAKVEPQSGRPVLGGLSLAGATDVSIRGLSVRGRLTVGSSSGPESPSSQGVLLTDLELSDPEGPCLLVRDGSRDVTIRNNYIHNCAGGIGGPVQERPSTNIRIEDNRIEKMTGDGIQLGFWRRVVIDGNTITDLYDPKKVIHNDAIQIVGEVDDVTISNNRLSKSGGQLIMIGRDYGPISNIRIVNNLLTDGAAYAIQAGGVPGLEIRNNTIWDSKWGLLLRPAPDGTRPTDTVLVDNVLNHLSIASEYAPLAENRGNVVAKCDPPVPEVRCDPSLRSPEQAGSDSGVDAAGLPRG